MSCYVDPTLVQRYTLKMSSLNCLFLNTFSTFLITFRSVCKFLGKPNSQHSHNRKRLPNRRFDYSVSSVSLSKQHHFVIGVWKIKSKQNLIETVSENRSLLIFLSIFAATFTLFSSLSNPDSAKSLSEDDDTAATMPATNQSWIAFTTQKAFLASRLEESSITLRKARRQSFFTAARLFLSAFPTKHLKMETKRRLSARREAVIGMKYDDVEPISWLN